ncbi:hypothetical protein [Paenibacillus hemerocallicola]|uniref:hypothetical protein n=1 Tax=Paenibacillus hemerocallicola TaxID=1172614 RepID=UPI001C407B3B|nr:hypothetical protein [Paenibacillus hemerocallicola]
MDLIFMGVQTIEEPIFSFELQHQLHRQPYYQQYAMYISKFVAACSAGLFDAALNMLWNETVVNLREKVKRFDMDYFLDSVITDSKRRAAFRSEDDLAKLEEWELVKGCRDTGIITDIGFKHLDYIRDKRNHASAAHPNHNDLSGLQLVSWLETCIKEVLVKEPKGAVVQINSYFTTLGHRPYPCAGIICRDSKKDVRP